MMPAQDSSYLANVSARVVRTFQRYAKDIDPNEESFLMFLSNYLTQKGVGDPRLLPYSQLYTLIKDGIREYLHLKDHDEQSQK